MRRYNNFVIQAAFGRLFCCALIFAMFPALGCSQVTIGGGVTFGGGVTIGGASSGAQAPVFSPTGGTYTGTQSVTISCPRSGDQATYTTDGSTPNIASALYSAPISVSATTTIKALCSDTPVYEAETQQSSTNYKCVTPNAQTYGSLTCEAGGGVTGQPTNVALTFGSTMNYSQTSTGLAQSLIPYTFHTTNCQLCDHIAQDMWIEAQGTAIQNNEADAFLFNTVTNTEYMLGLQSNEQAGTMQWQIDSGGSWVNTGVATGVPISTSAYTHVSMAAHWTLGTANSILYDDLCINGTCTSLNSLGSQPTKTLPAGWTDAVGNQSQLDSTSAGGTIGRNIQHNTVAAAIGPASAVTSATYTISSGQTSLTVTPSSIAEGSVLANTTTYFQLVTVKNTGSADLNFSSIAFNGANASDFAVTQGFSPAVNPIGGNTLPQCLTTESVAPGDSCIVPVEFMPGATGARSASLTLADNATGSPQSVALSGTGTSASGTVLPACGSLLAANTTYYANADITCSGSGFGVNGDNVTVNLNGHTVTAGNSPAQVGISSWAFYAAPSSDYSFGAAPCAMSGANFSCGLGTTPTSASTVNNLVVENGTIAVAPNATSAATEQAGSAAFYGYIYNSSIHDVAVTIGVWCISCQAMSGYRGSDGTYNGIGDVVYKTTVTNHSGQVYSRCEYEGADFVFSNTLPSASPGPVFYENTLNYTPQDGIAAPIDYASIFGNTIKVGNPSGTNAGTNSTCSGIGTGTNGTQSWNDFAVGLYGSNSSAVNNTISNYEGRGIDLTEGETTPVNTYSAGNTITTTDLPNYVEGGSAGNQIGGAYGIRINNFGNTSTANFRSVDDGVTVTCGTSEGFALSISNNANTSNYTQGGSLTARYSAGSTKDWNCAAFQDDSHGYSNSVNFTVLDKTFSGDTADVEIGNGEAGMSGPLTIIDSTFDKPTSAVAGWCGSSANSIPETSWNLIQSCYPGYSDSTVIGPVYLVNPIFTGGATAADNDFALATQHLPAGTSASYFLQWTYQVTVTNSSGSPVSGATVTATDTLGTVECTATTDASGVAICDGKTAQSATNGALKETGWSFTAPGAVATTTFNPFAFSIAASGCTTLNYSESITAKTAETKQLSGC